MNDIQWWIDCPLSLPSTSLEENKPDLFLTTDASLSGWGAILSSPINPPLEIANVSGSWSENEKSYHINFLELSAIHLAILSFSSKLKNKVLHIFSDNKTSVCYLKKMGGTHSIQLCHLAIKIWNLLIKLEIDCKFFYIQGNLNRADYFSRLAQDPFDYYIDQSTFDIIRPLVPFNLQIDLFATRLSNKLEKYVSWHHDPYAWKVDAFSFTWPNNIYIFPPIHLISKALNKFISDKVQVGLLITPAWKNMQSIPIIYESLCSYPIFLPAMYVEDVENLRHRPFAWMAWPISTSAVLKKAFQNKQLLPSGKVSSLLQSQHISASGKDFVHMLMRMNIRVLCPFQ